MKEAPNARGKIYHLYGHESSTGLDIKTRCNEAGCQYVELPITGDPEVDLDHEGYEKFKQRLIGDLRENQVLVFIADPPCEPSLAGDFARLRVQGDMARRASAK